MSAAVIMPRADVPSHTPKPARRPLHQELAEQRSAEDAFDCTLEHCLELVEADYLSAWSSALGSEHAPLLSWGIASGLDARQRMVEQRLVQMVQQQGISLNLQSANQAVSWLPQWTGQSLLVVPVRAAGQTLGSLVLLRSQDRPGFSREEQLQICSMAACLGRHLGQLRD